MIPLLIVLGYQFISQEFAEKPQQSQENIVSIAQTLPEVISFNFDVKPILSDKCFTCHGPDANTREANLRLDLSDGLYNPMMESPDKIPVVPFEPESSEIIRRIFSSDSQIQMPPSDSHLSLTQIEKQMIRQWIQQGAPYDKHWAYILPKKPDIKAPFFPRWELNEIDWFIGQKIHQNGWQPSQSADKETLLRRVYFDVIGLPPSIEEIDAFLADESENAYEKVVDKLLDSEHYGERMASIWLDIARYADTHGYQDDLERFMWPWRDWVIHAYNQNLPYDQFITWQLAGDLLPNPTKEQILATGFNRNHSITQEGGVIPEEYRVEYVADRTITTARTMLGITMDCARCHDHKYDAISQEEYYGFFSFFNQLDEKGLIDYGEFPEPRMPIDKEIAKRDFPFVHFPDSISKFYLMVMEDTPGIRTTHVLDRGVYNAPTTQVSPKTPEAILAFGDAFEKNRLGLSQWLFDDNNPLTARVTVNRLWQQFFGQGIVSTPDDFGNQGAIPSHPELLDYLAHTFQFEDQWDVKKIIKRMVSSATYKQSSMVKQEYLNEDPLNTYWTYYPRVRLKAEMIRDNALATSGLLVQQIGGPSVKPPQPEGLWREKGGNGLVEYIPDGGENRFRRSLYTFWKRTVPPPNMLIFDAAYRDFCTVERQKTSTPLQSLVLMNDPQFTFAAKHLIESHQENFNHWSLNESIEFIYRTITCHKPNELELQWLADYYHQSMGIENPSDSNIEASHPSIRSVLMDVALLIYNLDITTQKS